MLTPPDILPAATLAAIQDAASRQAAERDADGGFPRAAFDALSALGLTAHPPNGARQMPRLLRVLAAVGRGDLSTGRIFEGHVNSLFLMQAYGTPAQRQAWSDAVARGALYGIWNTDQPGAPLRLEDRLLVGRKTFSTGIDGLERAIVTIDDGPLRQMIVVPLAGLDVDRTWWKPMGMRASGSHLVDFTGLEIEDDWLLGGPGDYVRQPWFSAGAMRFAAVQVGGMHALLDIALEHLRRTNRTGDPYQLHRIAEMGLAVDEGYGWLDRAGGAWAGTFDDPDGAAGAAAIAAANAARCGVERLALEVLELAERGIGAAGLIAPHPFERRLRDLRTYLRQPNPDGALAALGKAMADDQWRPGGSGEG